MPLEYTEFNWPGTFTLVFPFSGTEAAPMLLTGNASTPWTPPSGKVFKVKRLFVNGVFSAVGTGVILQVRVHKGSIGGSTTAMQVLTDTTDVPGDVTGESSTPSNPATGMDVIGSTGMYVRIVHSGGDTYTVAGVVMLDCEYQ